jgi:putative redox protein
MQASPRRIAAIEVTMHMPNVTYTPKERALLENAARTCPVALSLHPELEQKLSFVYQ